MGELISLIFWVFKPINTVCVSIYLDLWFLTSAFCTFQHTLSVRVMLDLHLSISFFGAIFLVLCFNFTVHVFTQYMEIQLIFLCLSCLIDLVELISSGSFFVDSLEFFYVDNHAISNRDSFVSSILMCMHFISPSCSGWNIQHYVA